MRNYLSPLSSFGNEGNLYVTWIGERLILKKHLSQQNSWTKKILSNTHVEENRSPCQLSFLMDSSTPANVCFKKIRQMKDTMLWWIRRKESVFRNNIIYELDVTYADWRKTRHPLFMFVTAVWKIMWEIWLSKVRKMPFLFFLFFVKEAHRWISILLSNLPLPLTEYFQ